MLVEPRSASWRTKPANLVKPIAGADIPMSVGSRPDADGAVLHVASRIRVLLGHDSGATHMHNVQALIAAGKTIDAIRILREEEGLSLLDAKRRIEELTQSK